jgi:hypothetical protein
MRKSKAAVIGITLLILLCGFAFAYFYNLVMFNQTKSRLESKGYTISNNVDGVDVSTFVQHDNVEVVPVADLDFFLSLAQSPLINSTTIYEQGQNFYTLLYMPWFVGLRYQYTAYQYTPSNHVWWIF